METDVDPTIIKDSSFTHNSGYGHTHYTSKSSLFMSDVRPSIGGAKTSEYKVNDNRIISLRVTPTAEGLDRVFDNPSLYEVNLQFHNHTNKPISVTDRNNITVTIPNHSIPISHMNEVFIVRRRYLFKSLRVLESIINNHENEKQFFTYENDEREKLIHWIRSRVDPKVAKNPFCNLTLDFDRILPLSVLNTYKSMYIHDLDLVIKYSGVSNDLPHPSSVEALHEAQVLNLFNERHKAGFLIEIVDNEGAIKPRYIYLAGDVIKITPKEDINRKSGVYYQYLQEDGTTSLKNISTTNLLYVSLDQCEQAHVYPTIEEARAGGDVILKAKLDNAVLDVHRETLKLHQQDRKYERDEELMETKFLNELRIIEERTRENMEKMIADAYKRNIDHENNLYEKMRTFQEAMLESVTEAKRRIRKEVEEDLSREKEDLRRERNNQRQDEYEDRSYRRKETSELIRLVPSFLAFIALGFTAYNTYAGNKNNFLQHRGTEYY